jgi:hypothetical protein
LSGKFGQLLPVLGIIDVEILGLVIIPFEFFELQPVFSELNRIYLGIAGRDQKKGKKKKSAELYHKNLLVKG